MDTTLGEITQSLGNVAGGLTSFDPTKCCFNHSSSLMSSTNLQDTDFAEKQQK